MADPVLTYTTAPEAYDGFGTQTVKPSVATDKNGQTVRLVSTPAEHADWQRGRYASGCHMACDEASFDKFRHLFV